MKLGVKFSLMTMTIILVLSIALVSIGMNVLRISSEELTGELFKEKVQQLVTMAYDQDELLFEGVNKSVEDAQWRVIDKIRVGYRTKKDNVTFPFVIDIQGNILVHPDHSRWNNTLDKSAPKITIFDAGTIAAMRAQKEGEVEFVHDGIRRWCVFKLYEPWNWIFCMTTTLQQKNADMISFKRSAIGISLVMTLASILLVLLFSHAYIAPLHRVMDKLREIVSGGVDYSKTHPIKVEARDEIGELAGTVNKMTEDLSKVTTSRDYLDNIITVMNDGLFKVDVQTSEILDVNRKGCSMFGFTKEELVGKKIQDIENTVPDMNVWHEHMKLNEPEGHFIYEGMGRRKDGSIFPHEVNVNFYQDERTGRRYLLSVVRDISMRREVEAKLNNIFGIMNDGLFTIDAETSRFLDVNPKGCSMFGFTREEFLKKYVHEVDTQITDVNAWQTLMARLKSEDSFLITGEGRRRDGSCFPIEVSSRLSKEKLNGRHYIISVVRDVTVRKRLEHDLAEAQVQIIHNERLASIGQLAAGVAHEINNPMGFVSSNVETLGQYIRSLEDVLKVVLVLQEALKAGDEAKTKSTLERLISLEEKVNLDFITHDLDDLMKESREGIERIKKIITNLRTFSRKSGDATSLLQIEDILENVLNIIHNEIKYKVDLKKEYGHPPMFKASRQHLGQVFLNILLNGVQAIDKKGEITVKTYEKDKCACVEIKDTGKGIAPEHLDHIFDAFFTTKAADKGTGLGLTISRQIALNHGGDILVSSKLGAGTTFTVKLPLERKEAE